MEKRSNPSTKHSARRPSFAQRLLSTWFRRPAIWVLGLLAVITLVGSGAASSLLRQLPRQLNPVTFITGGLEKTLGRGAEETMVPPVLSASTIPGTVAPAQTISGTLYDSAGSPITSGRTIKLVQNGTIFGTATTNGSGSYGFTGVTLASGDKIVVFISGAAEKGATVTLAGTLDITNLNIRQNSLIVRTDNGGPITNANLKEGEGVSPDSDLTAVRMVDGTNVLTLPAGFHLQIWPGSTFAPGANIHDGGNWTNNGAFVPGTHRVTFNGNSNQTISGSSSTTFYELTISNTGTSPANHVTLDGSGGATNTVVSKLTINSGVFDQGIGLASSDLVVDGGAGTFTTCIFIPPGGRWENFSYRDVTLYCDVSNQGTIEFNSNGTACGQPDDIRVRSSVNGIQRTWAGPGTFSMTDVDVRDQRVPGGLSLPQEIDVNSGTNAGNNGGWIFSNVCGSYTWIGAFGPEWDNPYNWSPVRYSANNAFTSDVLIFNGNVTPSPLVHVETQTNASIQLKNGVAVTMNPIGGGTLTLNGGTGSDLAVPAGTLLKFDGLNPLIISLTAAGHQCDVGGQIIMQGSNHKLLGANPGAITMSGSPAITTQSGFTGNPFGTGVNGSVVFLSGSRGNFNAGDDPFGGLNSVVTFNSGSTARFGATSAFSSSGRTYGNLILGGNQNYPPLLGGQTTVQNNFVLESDSTWTLSGDLNLLGNFEDQSLGAGTFDVNSRTVKFQGGSATQTIFKPGTNPLNFGDVFVAETPGGKVQLLSSININGQLNLSTADSLLELNGKTLELNGTVTGSGNLKGSGASKLHINGIGPLGTLKFLSGFRTLSELKMNRVLPSGSVTLGNDLMVNDALFLTNGVVNMGSFTLTVNGAVNRNDGYIIGNEQRFITCANTCPTLTFDVGTLNGYSPVSTVLHVGAIPGTYSQTIKAIQGQHPSIHGGGVNALQRYWTLSSVTGPSFSNADITFNYLAGDVVGIPASYVFFKNSTGAWSQAAPAGLPTSTSASINGVNSFSDWTLAQAAAVTPGNLQFSAANYDNTEQNLSTHTATIMVRRVGGTDGAVSVHWATSAGTATPGSDYTESSGDLNWADGEAGNKTFTVTVSGDTDYESNETVNLTLSAPTGLAGLGTPNPATLTITNDDTADTDVALLGGSLEIVDINGGNTDDTLTISLNGSNVRINDPNHTLKCGMGATVIDTNTCEVPLASITGSIQINSLAGSDSLTLALANGNFFPPGGVNYHGGDPTTGPGDKLFITGGSQGAVTYHYTNAHDGTIAMSNFGTVSYTGLEPISNSGTATDVIFELPLGPNAATLTDDGTVSNTMSRLSGATFENTNFANPTASLTIKRGNAADIVAVNALPDFNASLTIGSASNEFNTITFNGAITLAANNSLAANAASAINLSNGANILTTNGTGTISLTAANITGAGNVSTGGGLTVSNTGTSSALSGVIAGTGGLTKLGAGTLVLSGTNTYGGATLINGGRLNVNGSITSNTTVNATGTLGGTGTINSANTVTVSGGTVAPGTSPGILNTGNVSFDSSSTFAVEDGGTTPGNLSTNHDQLNVTGTVSLGNATLNLSPLGFTPSAGQTFVIVNNDGADSITGNFILGTGGTDENGGSLAEGDTITNFLGSALEATITYQGGMDTNDVVLTAVTPVITPGNLQFSAANYNDTELNSGTHLVTITVQRVDGTDGAVSVHWATSAGTASPGSDYTESSGDVSWIAGNADPQTFTVTVSGDTAYEFNETVNLTLSAPTGDAGLGTPNPATLTIINDDIADTDVALSGGNLQITDVNGANTDDTLVIRLNGSNVRISDSNHTLNCGAGTTAIDANICEVLLASITGLIQVDALAGSDSLVLDLGGGNFFPPGGVTYNGGDPTTGPGDKLFITNGSQGTVTYHYTNAHDGSIAMSNIGTVSYTGLEPITNTGDATNIIFELPAGPNAVTLADEGTGGNTMSQLSGTTLENTTFANPTASLMIKRGNAADTVAVNALPDFDASLAIGSAGSEFSTITFTGAITLAANNGLAANASTVDLSNGSNPLTTSGTGTISLTAANVSGAGNVSTGGGLTISNTGSSSTLSGVIAGPGGLTKLGAGTLVLSGTNTYGGVTLINGGRLNVNGSINSNTTVNATGTLGGTGTINSANTVTVSGGTVAPGTSAGILNTGNVSFDSSSSFAVEIGGITPGTNHDQLNVTGTVSLGNATLNLSPISFTPSAGQAFVIINNDGADLTTGNLILGTGGTDPNGGSLAEGDTITNFLGSTLKATITYQGGTNGNDVVLTAATPIPGNLQFLAANYDDPEQNSGTHTATITVQRVGGIDGAVSVHWATSAGTASPGSDYTESAGDLNWADGDGAAKTFTVTVNGDTAFEFNETVNLTLSASTGGAGLGTPNPATLTITNDDVSDSHVSLLGGSLQITDVSGGNTDDTFTISLNGPNVRITDPTHTLSCGAAGTAISVNTCEVPLASITGSIQINSLAGSDSLTLALANGNFFPPGGVNYHGGDPTTGPGDKLFITGGSQGTVTYHYTNAHDGSILMSNIGAVSYSGLEPISNTGTATDIIFELPPGPNAATLADDGIVSNTMSRLSGATFETTDFANPAASLLIKPGNAADTVEVNALPDFNASLSMGSFSAITFNGEITLATNRSLAASASSAINLLNGANVLTTSGTGTISLTGADVTGAGYLSTGGGLTVSNTGSNSTLSGVIAGTGGLTKLGAGTLALLGTNTYTGATAVNLGRLDINGSIDSNTTVDSGAILGGRGTINSLNTLTVNDGVLAPGTSPGIFNTGNVTLNSTSSFAVEIGGITPGNLATDHDQLNVTGTVSLGNAVLSQASFNSFTPTVGQTFVIIINDGTADTVTGTFNGLPEGATIPNFLGSALKATISYQGGDGNDVVLTAAAPVSGNLQFSAANYNDTEQNSSTHTVTITVQRVGGIDGAVSVHWATSAGTATPGSDYTESTGDLNWANADAADKTFTVTVSGDTAYELNETVNLTLSAPTGGAGVGTPNPATLTITNDDTADTDVVLSGVNLQVTDVNGGNSDDTLIVSRNGSNVRINDPNHTLNCGLGGAAIDANTCEVPLASIVTGIIQVDTLAGNDSVTLALAGGNFFPAGGVSYNGGAQTTSDKLFITGGSNQGKVTYRYTNANDGSVEMFNFGTVTYTGLEPISNTGTATEIIFELPPGPTNPATLEDDGTVGNNMSRLSGATFETTDFANPTASLTIKRGNAADTIAVNALPDFDVNLVVGEAVNPFATITVNGTVAVTGGAAISLIGGDVTGGGNLTTGIGLTVNNTGTSSTLSGVIAGTGGLTKVGAGTLVLSGTNTYGGVTLINGGRLDVNGSITSNTTVNPTGTLGGTGTINSANTVTVSGGTVAPGTSAGILNTGNVSFDSSSSFAVEIGGITPGTNHDQLNVTGTVSLGNATLNLSPISFTPSVGQTFVIINNDSADAVTGTFNGLPEGTVIPNFLGSTSSASITYVGGSNLNNVVLTVVEPEMDVEGGSPLVSIADSDNTPSTADATDFGSVGIGNSLSHTFTILNTGTAPLNLTGTPKVVVTGSSDFVVTTQPGSPLAAVGGSTTFVVQYTPSALGAATATISIANDDTDENPYDFALSGNGIDPCQTLIVNVTGDEPDATPDGICETAAGNGFCTLRAAIMESNASSCAPLTINFSLLPGSEPQQILLEDLLPAITRSVTIQGPLGQMVSVDGDDSNRIFEVASGITVNISNLIITNGFSTSDGAGLVNNGGTVNISNCVFTGNQTSAANGAAIANNAGTLSVWNSTFSLNQTTSSGNGGAIYVNSGIVTLTNNTISENGAADNAGGVYNNAGTVNVRNTIIAGNLSSGSFDVQGTFISQGHNLISIGDGSTGFVDGTNGDHVGTEVAPVFAELGPFDDHGGTTLTYSLLPTSPALEGGDNCVLSGCSSASPTITTDQRNVTRPQSAKVDIGAYEMDTSVVNTTADHAPGLCEPLGPPGADCTLREAINAANASTNPSQIAFDIPTGGSDPGCVGGVCTIALDSVQGALPEITQPVMIDGYSQTGAMPNTQNLSVGDNATLTIVLSGFASPGLIGLDLCAGSTSSAVKGLVINNFPGSGIQLENDGLNLIAGNFIGTDATAMNAVANGNGIAVVLGVFNIIGGEDPAARNIISGNTGDGVQISGPNTGINAVEGNYIGTKKDGDSALSNNIGVNMFMFTGSNTIGCETENGDNVISGNTTAGIRINESDSNTIEGNLIGTDKAGVHAIPNGVGVDISDASDNAVGFFGYGSVISGNTGAGVQIKTTGSSSYPSSGNLVYSNKIGTNAAGTDDIPNDTGILIQDSSINDIGSGDPADRNLISGNTHEGVRLENANGTFVFGNFIGTDVTGSAAIPNAVGVEVDGGSANEIGCTVPGSTNVISGNTGDGVEITGPANENFVQNNLIGVQADGTSALGNGGVGVEVYSGAHDNVIGVEPPLVFIGDRPSPDAAQPKSRTAAAAQPRTAPAGGGCSKRATVNNQNTQAFKAAQQLKARAAKAVQNSAQFLSRAALNGRAMKDVVAAATSTKAKASGNAGTRSLTGAKVQGIPGKGPAPSIVSISGVNVIANNGKDGVRVSSTGDFGNLISQNEIFSNGALGINLGPDGDGVTPNNSAGHTGPNLYQNFPLINFANPGDQNINFSIDGTGGTQPFTIEFFVNSACDGTNGEGKKFIGSTIVNSGGPYTFVPPIPFANGEVITATATDAGGNTSEFSVCKLAGPPAVSIDSVTLGEGQSGTTVFTFNVTLSSPTSQVVTVQYATQDGTTNPATGGTCGTVGVDYATSSGTVTFNPGETTMPVTISVCGDTFIESDETFFVNLSNPVNATIANVQGTGTILNDDCPTTFEVNNSGDTPDFSPGDGFCGDVNQNCTLRAAIDEANALTNCGTISITFNIGSVTINVGSQLTIDHNVNIIGPTANSVSINGNSLTRLFGVNFSRTASISNLTLTGGKDSGVDGGGAILNNGTLTLNAVTLNGNSANNGGAISSDGALILTNTTISGNRANGDGGGLYQVANPATLTNVTIADNRSDYDNNASGTGGGVFRAGGNVLLHNTIVADNYQGPTSTTTADNIGGSVDALSSYNVIGAGTGGLLNTNNNQVGVATALLGALMNNGGPTFTHGLLYNSPAVDSGDGAVLNSPLFISVDQRSLPRPADGDLTPGTQVDIGAYERQATETRPVPVGSSVLVDINDARVTFPCVPAGGCGAVNREAGQSGNGIAPAIALPELSLSDVDPATQPAPPPGYVIGNGSSPALPAFNLSTAGVTYDTPVTVCFYLPSITDGTFFNGLRIFHNNGSSLDLLANQTTNFANRLVCGEVNSFSPFVIGHTVTPTAADGSVTGQILDNTGNPVEGAAVRMNGTQNRLTVTDAAGRYHFDEVETNGLYVVTPSRPNFTFSPPQRSFSQLGANTEATFTAVAGGGTLNPLDTTEYFVRQQYLDFLGREPDEAGFNFWVNNIQSCNNNAGCREAKRIDTSAAFFLSIEFQQTGYVVYRTYQAAYSDLPNAPVPLQLTEFRSDAAQISKGVVVLQNGWQRTLETNKKVFAEDFVKRARFAAEYPLTMTPTEFVDKLFANAAIPLTDDDHAAAIGEFARAADSSDVAARGRALRRVAENSTLTRRRFNRAFVLMEYFGYLRRDPNSGQDRDFAGYNFWLDKLDRFDGNFQEAEMVKAFLSSIEYRARFPR